MQSYAELRLAVGDTWDDEYYYLLKMKLRDYNRRTALSMEPPEALPLNIRAEDESGRVLGGIAAVTYWGWLVIKLFVLDAELRGNGLGQWLIETAHEEARLRGCSCAQTATYDFQALRFYQKHGYRIVGELADYPAGHTYYWLRAELARDSR